MEDAARAACGGCWIPLIKRLLNLSVIKGWERGTFRLPVCTIVHDHVTGQRSGDI